MLIILVVELVSIYFAFSLKKLNRFNLQSCNIL